MVTTLPGNPTKKTVIIPVMIANLIAQISDDVCSVSINTTGLKPNYGGSLLEEVEHWKIPVNEIYDDVALAKKLIGYINPEIQLEVIEEKMVTCDCQKLELPLSEISSLRHKARKVEKEGKCMFCSTSKIVNALNLYMVYPSEHMLKVHVHPVRLQKNFDNSVHELYNSKKRISKIRKTGTIFSYQGNDFNLDPDFTSLLFFAFLVDRGLTTLIHVHRYISHLARVAFICSGEIDAVIIPYLDRLNDHYEDMKNYITDPKDFLLTIASNFSWKKINTTFDFSTVKTIAKMDNDKKEKMHRYLLESESIDQLIERFNNNIFSFKSNGNN